jgi:hypothetical protein
MRSVTNSLKYTNSNYKFKDDQLSSHTRTSQAFEHHQSDQAKPT